MNSSYVPFSCQKKGPDRIGNGDKTSPFVSSGRYIPLEFMASKDDDSTPISSPITGPPQHETAMGSVQSPTPPLVYPLPSPTPSYSIRIEPPSVAPPSIPLPWLQNPDFIEATEQKQQSSWSSWYPSIPHALRRSPDLNHQEVPSPITPFIPPRSLPDTPADDVGENENHNPSTTRGPANSQVSTERKELQFYGASPSAHPISTEQNRHRSRDPSMRHSYRRDLGNQGTQRRGPSFDTSNYRAGVNADYHNSGWGSSTPNYLAPRPTANDRDRIPTSYAAAPWPRANYPGLSPPANDHDRMPPSAGTVSQFGVLSAASSPYGIATRVDEAMASTHPITSPTSTHSTIHSASMHPIISPTSTRPTTANDHDRMPPSGAGTVLQFGVLSAASSPYGIATRVDEAMASTHPITSPTSTHSTIHPTSMHSTIHPTSVHPTTSPTSTHPITNTSWDVHVYSQTLQIKGERLRRYQIVRSKLRFESQLNDLFSGSLGVWHHLFFSEEITGLTVHTYLISPDNSATPTP